MNTLSLRIKLIGSYLCIAFITGIACIIGLSYLHSIHHDGLEIGESLAPLADAAMEVKLTATSAHLIFEEIMSGDTSEDINEVYKLLEDSLFYANTVINDGKNDEGVFHPSENEEVRKKAEKVISGIHTFISATKTRYQGRNNQNGFDQEADNTFDASFEQFTLAADEMEEMIHNDMIKGIATLNKNRATADRYMIMVTVFAVASAVVIGFIMTKSITGSMAKCSALTASIGKGDLKNRIDLTGIPKDEIGGLAASLNTMTAELNSLITEISTNSSSLSTASTQLDDLSASLATGAEDVSTQTNSVAAATEEMSTNINSISAAMEQTSTNVELVAAATNQMTATVNEIAQNSAKARTITENAVTKSKEASQKIEELGEAASQIGKVTETITEISEQTNLLALNATIEAARAGEAGKGFAVVANEIKELAKQTASATQDIKEKISNVQGNTEGAVTIIEDVSKVINTVFDIISSIATVIEEQSITTKEISNNVTQMSAGIQEVNENVSQSSMVADEISKDINTVNHRINQFNQNSSDISSSASLLADLAEKLKDLTSRFKV